MNAWGRQPFGLSAKTGWRAKGFEDGTAGHPRRDLSQAGGGENVDAYHEGYRIGKRERERAK